MSYWLAWLPWCVIDFQLAATLLLGAALVGARWIKQPVHRVTLGWATSLALILLAGAAALPAWPRFHAIEHGSERRRAGITPAPPSGEFLEPDGSPLVGLGAETEPVHFGPLPRWSPQRESLGSRLSMLTPSALVLSRVYLLGSAATCLWLVLGTLEASWLCRVAQPAPARLHGQLQAVVGEEVRPPRLLLCRRVHNAVALGILRPTILLPTSLAEQADEKSLRAVLAHEAAHIRNRDLWLLGLMRGLLVVLFPHPLYWVVRHLSRASQEAVADAVAADSRRDDYADGLIGWMRHVTASKRMLAAPAVGIWEPPSELSRRITMLIDEQFTVQKSASPSWRVGTMALVSAVALGLSLVTVRPAAVGDPGQLSKPKDAATVQLAPANPQTEVPSLADTNNLSFTGRVIDKVSHEPVQGATVRVRREIYSSTDHRILEETEHLTDAEGRFSFRLTPEQATNRSAYLNFEVTHPDYARRPWDGYSLSMIRKNESLGQRPFFEELDLDPAESISGTLVQADGTPAAGVKVLTYSKARKNDMAEYGSFGEGRTDASGLFRVNVVKGGEAVLWLLPQEFVPSTHLLHQQRGDLGRFILEDGIRLTGRVLDSDGKPVSHVWVNAELSGGPAKKQIGMPVADALSRSALTDQEGQFATGPLPVGDYDILITEYRAQFSQATCAGQGCDSSVSRPPLRDPNQQVRLGETSKLPGSRHGPGHLAVWEGAGVRPRGYSGARIGGESRNVRKTA